MAEHPLYPHEGKTTQHWIIVDYGGLDLQIENAVLNFANWISNP